MIKCPYCNTEHNRTDSQFCSQDCFDRWYDATQLPSMVVDWAIKSVAKSHKLTLVNQPKEHK